MKDVRYFALVFTLLFSLVGCQDDPTDPDLVVKNLNVDWPNKKARADISNIGKKDAKEFLVYFNGDESPISQNYRPQVSHNVPGLKSGETVSLESDFAPLAHPDNNLLGNIYRISVLVDPKNVVHESDESNNEGEDAVCAANWTPFQNISNTAGTSQFPRIAVYRKNIHVVWIETGQVLYKNSVDNGATWRPTQVIHLSTPYTDAASIAVDGNNIYVVWSGGNTANLDIFYRQSSDNGTTWSPLKSIAGVTGLGISTGIAVNGSHIHVVWNDRSLTNYGIHYIDSTDNGFTWSSSQNLSNSAGLVIYPAIEVFRDNVHVVWQGGDLSNKEVFYTISKDNGATWSAIQNLSNNAGESREPSISIYEHNIHVAWNDVPSGSIHVPHYRNSVDNGSTWSSVQSLHNVNGATRPDIGAAGDNIHLVWATFPPGASFDIFYKQSADKGATWPSAQNISAEPAASMYPSIATYGCNTHVAWVGGTDIYYKGSTAP